MDGWDVLNILRCHGKVATPQRLKLLSFFLKEYGRQELVNLDWAKKDLYLAKRVHEAMIAEGYFISLSSIYKNMDLFKRLGIFGDDSI